MSPHFRLADIAESDKRAISEAPDEGSCLHEMNVALRCSLGYGDSRLAHQQTN
jgi:hypothetical protein